MAIKTAQNKNIYSEREINGNIPVSPAPRAYRWVNDSVEGTYDTITNDTKLPGRNPEKDRKGTDSSTGDFTTKWAPDEQDELLEDLLCGNWTENTNDGVADIDEKAMDLVPGSTQRSRYLLKEFSQNPVKYQLFTGLQVNSLNMQFTVKSLINAVFNLMGANNPQLVDAAPVSLANKVPPSKTEQFITLKGFVRFDLQDTLASTELANITKAEIDVLPEQRYATDFSLTITNNMKSIDALFQEEAVEKSLGMLNVTGSITDYLIDGELYNLAKQSGSGLLVISVNDGNDIRYDILMRVSFDNSSMTGEEELSSSLPWKTFGQDRFLIRKYSPAE